jgi:ABC-2 type transport system permease protein
MHYANTVYVLWLRQLKRYVRSKSRMIASLAQPLLFLLALGFGFGPIYQQAGGGNYIQFLAPGIIAMTVLTTSMFAGIEVIWDRQFGFLKETLVAPVPRWIIMLGRTLGGATVATLQGVVVSILALAVGFRPQSLALVPAAIGFMFLAALLFTAFGTAVASRMQDMQAFPLIMNFLVMPMFFLSGSLFPLKGLPAALTLVAKLNPMSYAVDAIRGTLVNGSHFGLGVDVLALGLGAIVLVVIGGRMFAKIQI